MILRFCHGIVAERAGGIAKAVFIALEIEDITIPKESPMVEASDVKTEVPAVLIVDARGLRKSIAELVVKIRRIVAV